MKEEDAPIAVTIKTKTIIEFILWGLLVAVLFALRELILVLLTSIVIASFIEGVVRRVKKYKIPRTITVVVVYIFSITVVVWLFSVFVPIFMDQFTSVLAQLKDYIPSTSILNNLTGNTVTNTKELVTNISGNVPVSELLKNVQTLVSGVSGGFVNTASVVFGGLLNLVLIIVISFYLSMEERGIENFLRIITPAKNEEYVINLWSRTERKIGLWMQGQLLLGVLIGVMLYLGLTILGLDYALIIAVLAAVCELIPYGLILAIIPALGFAYAGGGALMVMKVGALYIIVQQFENYLIAPLIVKKVTGVPSLVVILSLLIGATLAGFWGLILGVPVAVFVLEYLSDIEKKKSIRYTA